MPVLDSLKSPFAELLEPVQDISCYPVVYCFPDLVDYADS